MTNKPHYGLKNHEHVKDVAKFLQFWPRFWHTHLVPALPSDRLVSIVEAVFPRAPSFEGSPETWSEQNAGGRTRQRCPHEYA